jgi:hypothetical protein
MLPVGLADFMRGTLLRIVWPVNGILHGFARGRYRPVAAPETAAKRGPIRKKNRAFSGARPVNREEVTARADRRPGLAGSDWQKGVKNVF